MPFYEVHLHKTDDLVGRMVIKADTQQEARSVALEAAEKDHDDVIDYSVWEDEWIQLGEISGPDEPDFNFGAAYWDSSLNKWTTTKPYIFANEEGKAVGNPKKLGRSVDWAPYEEVGDWALPSGPSHRAEDKEWTPPKIPYKINDDVDAYDLQECPWCGDDMEHDGDHEGWSAHCGTCDGAIELRTITENIVVDIEPPTEKWTTDLADFSADENEVGCDQCNRFAKLWFYPNFGLNLCATCSKREGFRAESFGAKEDLSYGRISTKVCITCDPDLPIGHEMRGDGEIGQCSCCGYGIHIDDKGCTLTIENKPFCHSCGDNIEGDNCHFCARNWKTPTEEWDGGKVKMDDTDAESFAASGEEEAAKDPALKKLLTSMAAAWQHDCDLCPWQGDFEDFNYHIAYDCPGTISHRNMLVKAYESNFGAESSDPEETPAQMVERFRNLIRKTMKQMIGIIDELSDPVVLSKTVVKDLIDSSFELGYNSGNIDGKWEMKQEMMKSWGAEDWKLETPIVDRAMRLHIMIERATHHAMMVAMEQQALLAMLTQEGHWIEQGAEEIDLDWTPEEFGLIEPGELIEEIDDMEDHLGDLENQYDYALEEDNEDLEYILEEKIIEVKEDIEYLIHLLYEVEAHQFYYEKDEELI